MRSARSVPSIEGRPRTVEGAVALDSDIESIRAKIPGDPKSSRDCTLNRSRSKSHVAHREPVARHLDGLALTTLAVRALNLARPNGSDFRCLSKARWQAQRKTNRIPHERLCDLPKGFTSSGRHLSVSYSLDSPYSRPYSNMYSGMPGASGAASSTAGAPSPAATGCGWG